RSRSKLLKIVSTSKSIFSAPSRGGMELSGCETVQVVPLYTGAIGPAGSGADSYIGMFQANVAAIVTGLQQ
ncbi:MAG: hypothetical protein KC449_20825, partial [Anaerolineales bacterium]|nr:hypothetical protein [Anaerolineales bacterium]